MYNCFLHTVACNVHSVEGFVSGMNNLIEIPQDKENEFYKNENFWSIDISTSFFSHKDQMATTAISTFVERCKTNKEEIVNDEDANKYFPNGSNCFLGIDFSKTEGISNKITCLSDFLKYKYSELWDVDCNNFWSKKHLLFDRLVFCNNVKSQIESITDSKHFDQVLNKLNIFNKALKESWNSGDFSYKKITRDYPLIISPESAGTIRKYGNERTFQLPSGSSEIFDLHIKMGDMRIHLFPDNTQKIIYIGYIGKHLPIASDN